MWFLPNTQQILAHFQPALELTPSDRIEPRPHIFWRPNVAWGVALGLMLFVSLIRLENPSSFLYFQF